MAGLCSVLSPLLLGSASPPKLSADETELEIRGYLDGSASSFMRMLRLTLSGGGEARLRLLASDLKSVDGHAVVDRSNVAIPEGLSLTEAQPLDVPVTVKGVTVPGVYEGELRFVTVPPSESPLNIELVMNVAARPEVVAMAGSFGFQLTRCGRPTCWFNDLWLPTVLEGNRRDVVFDNRTGIPVEVNPSESNLLLRGDRSSIVLTAEDVRPKWPTEAIRTGICVIQLEVPRNRIPPDRYQGVLRLGIGGGEVPAQANVVMDVRDGLLFPVIILFVAVAFGRKIIPGKPQASTNKKVRTLAWFSGVATVADKETENIAKALAYGLLLFLLVLMGLKTLYVDSPTFGTQGIFDYLGLFLWGMSSDIAQRSLQKPT
jgi:hypothetical protein